MLSAECCALIFGISRPSTTLMDQRANNCLPAALAAGLATASFAADATESFDASIPVIGECHRNSPIIDSGSGLLHCLAFSGLHCAHLSCTHTSKAADLSAMRPQAALRQSGRS